MNAWIQAARPLAHANIAPPLLFGQALAYGIHGEFDWTIFVWVQLFGVFDHLFIVFSNDAADWRADVQNVTFNRYSGGSRVVPEGKLTPRDLAFAALFSLMGMTAVSLFLVFVKWRMFMLVATSLAVGLMWAYSFEPLRLSYRGRGEWLQGLGVGVLLPFIGFYAQSGRLLSAPWSLYGAGFLLGWAGNLVTSLPDTPSDRQSDKRTFSVRRGQAATRNTAIGAIALSAVIVGARLGAGDPLRAAMMVVVPLVPLVVAIRLRSRADADQPAGCEQFVTATGGAIALVWITGIGGALGGLR